jgi:hypothetical protein
MAEYRAPPTAAGLYKLAEKWALMSNISAQRLNRLLEMLDSYQGMPLGIPYPAENNFGFSRWSSMFLS